MRSGLPRVVDITATSVALLVLLPLLLLIAFVIRATSAGSPIFRQTRVGRFGRPFTMIKFRSMVANAAGPGITALGDARITPVGRWLRRFKLDELPQLWNVLLGDMSLVGPRPEVPQYVDTANPSWQAVLAVRPGLTDPVTLRLRDEEGLLAAASGDPDVYYRSTLLPWKLRGYQEYLAARTWRSDVIVILRTLANLLGASRPASTVAP